MATIVSTPFVHGNQSLDISGLKPNTNYSLLVRAYKELQNSDGTFSKEYYSDYASVYYSYTGANPFNSDSPVDTNITGGSLHAGNFDLNIGAHDPNNDYTSGHGVILNQNGLVAYQPQAPIGADLVYIPVTDASVTSGIITYTTDPSITVTLLVGQKLLISGIISSINTSGSLDLGFNFSNAIISEIGVGTFNVVDTRGVLDTYTSGGIISRVSDKQFYADSRTGIVTVKSAPTQADGSLSLRKGGLRNIHTTSATGVPTVGIFTGLITGTGLMNEGVINITDTSALAPGMIVNGIGIAYNAEIITCSGSYITVFPFNVADFTDSILTFDNTPSDGDIVIVWTP